MFLAKQALQLGLTHMLTRLLLLAMVGGSILTFSEEASAQSGSLCRPADHHSANLLDYLRDLMATTDIEDAADRDTLYRVPVVSPAQVQLETKASVCRRAAEAYAADQELVAVVKVIVVKLGSAGFAVVDPTPSAGEGQTVTIFSPQWLPIGGWGGN